jgi:hypothetical protein
MGRYVRDLPYLSSDVAADCRAEGLDAPMAEDAPAGPRA